ncbi:MAG: HDOD domain-containing protein [Actinomycetales bacterium]|nr:HDOD domain-containing protein [Actinomycetales bacterium]
MSVENVERLLARHEDMPARASAAARVVRLADDPDTSAQQLADAISPDPVFAARLFRVANSPYYGLGGRVSSLTFAVSVVGFQTVRSLAVAAAAGLDRPDAVPTGFWEASATCATAAELVAPLLGAHPGDAFSLGLLHTLGSALLHQHAPVPSVCLPEPFDPGELLRIEHDLYGITHSDAGARVLGAWQFPHHVCELISRHHEPLLPDAPPLERSLHTARALADRILTDDPAGLGTDHSIAWISEGRLTATDLGPLLVRLQEKAQNLLEGLRPSE